LLLLAAQIVFLVLAYKGKKWAFILALIIMVAGFILLGYLITNPPSSVGEFLIWIFPESILQELYAVQRIISFGILDLFGGQPRIVNYLLLASLLLFVSQIIFAIFAYKKKWALILCIIFSSLLFLLWSFVNELFIANNYYWAWLGLW